MPDLSGGLPASLRRHSRWIRLGSAAVPALLAHPELSSDSAEAPISSRPTIIWMHGRTVSKELDPGRYLRYIRAGLAVCALDLPGHGERFEARLQAPAATLEVVEQMVSELDGVVEALGRIEGFDTGQMGIGGMSAGGMATLVRLCRLHQFRCASVEATTGSWRWQAHREMHVPAMVDRMNPIEHLEQWRDIPLLAIHALHDEWVNIEGQREFIRALKDRSSDPDQIELLEFDRTGAPHEHSGFGRFAAVAKDRQTAFFSRRLLPS